MNNEGAKKKSSTLIARAENQRTDVVLALLTYVTTDVKRN